MRSAFCLLLVSVGIIGVQTSTIRVTRNRPQFAREQIEALIDTELIPYDATIDFFRMEVQKMPVYDRRIAKIALQYLCTPGITRERKEQVVLKVLNAMEDKEKTAMLSAQVKIVLDLVDVLEQKLESVSPKVRKAINFAVDPKFWLQPNEKIRIQVKELILELDIDEIMTLQEFFINMKNGVLELSSIFYQEEMEYIFYQEEMKYIFYQEDMD